MKLALLATALATGIVLAGPALAQGPHGRGHGEFWQTLDANKDGKVDKAEFDAHAKARFQAADQNGDGKISFEEAEAAREKRMQEHRKARFDAMDKDGDGILSEAEAGDRAMRMWIRADRDDDDEVTLGELRRGREMMHERKRAFRHHGEDGGDRPWRHRRD